MAINFTDSPADGATQVIGGRTYTYNTAKNKWDTTATEVVGPTATVYATVDNLPGTATTGDQAFVSGTNRLYIWNGSGWYNIALINTNPSISGVNSSYDLANDGTATVITITATDPEGLPITYSLLSDTSGNVATVTQGTGANTNVFTITPSTNNANGGTFSLTFRASDGVNIATALASFTLQFSVENSNYTTALITSVGANLAVNNTFVDSSTSSHTLTATGNPTQNTFSPYRHGGYSIKTVAGSSLGIPASTDNQFTGDFTIEGWVYSSDVGDKSLYVHGSYFAFNINFGTGFNIYLNSGGASFSPTDIVPASNEWNHVALVRSGSTVSVYLNGVASATTGTNSATLGYNSIAYIGGLGTQSPGSMNAYISDFRVVNGTAVYTSNFTPPTERLTAVTNTSVLACHLPYIADGSTNDKALAANGTITLEPFAPYDSSAAYSTSGNGGSIYFDGSGDYLQAPAASVARGTGNWTIECWAYFYSLATTNIIWDARTGATPTDDFLSVQSDGSLRYRSNGITVSSAGVVRTKVWHHIAQVLNNGTLKTYIDGKEVTSSSQTSNLSLGAALTIGGAAVDNSNWCNANFADFRVVLGTAVYTSAFTPPTAPLTAITNTSLLLNGTNAGIIDKSQSNKFLTLSGDAKSSTTQSKYLSSSIYFDGSGDNILTDVMTTNGDFTVEMWIRFDGSVANPASQSPTFFVWGTTTFMLYCTIANNTMQMIGNGSGLISGSTTISADTWYHVAFARQGNTGRLFVDGNLEGSTTSFTTDLNARAVIGSEESAGYPAKAYMSDVRVTKGLARYTANFTPPAAALQG